MANTSMNFTNVTDLGSDGISDPIGITYFCIGVVFIFLQLACAYLMHEDKEMQNPTYELVIHLSIVDAVELSAIGIYSGLMIILGRQNQSVSSFMAFVTLSAWYANCILFVFIGFSRWIAITRAHMVAHVFTKRAMTILHAFTWAPGSILCLYGIIIHDPPGFMFYPELFAWGFNLESRMGYVWHWIDCAMSLGTGGVEMVFNILSLIWVHQRRKHIQSFTASENRRREIKLLLQCFIMGCVFTLADIMFMFANAMEWSSVTACVSTQLVWLMNHSVNPLIYLSVNTKLRRNFAKFVTFGRCGPVLVAPTEIPMEASAEPSGSRKI